MIYTYLLWYISYGTLSSLIINKNKTLPMGEEIIWQLFWLYYVIKYLRQ